MSAAHWVSRQNQVAVAAVAHWNVRLEHRVQPEGPGQQPRLIIESAAANQPINLLQAYEVRLLMVDDVNDSLQRIAAVPTADALVDVPREQPHASGSS